ncbi:methyltransferase domain-containing protein [Leptolyngbya sp. FACHB-711]|uniref:methyltransferase domain-containing protein n=1 Tax=unclassified Leptolyngbya TaxID=2650499 RepID=UPI0016869E85|nr:methyltransferase domain-containing protein [Leptolyngbya sp. FACHB-711]MBD1852901.1 methyltransferase domain-containing protein [Cyanobacteria bacterium FACHB-502]MBD2023403.1 methyltransferase domain-containing protein [Leptolyngbya sp. FACHB-711]
MSDAQSGAQFSSEPIRLSQGGNGFASPESPEFWENCYQEGTARWDLGHPAPPFASLLDSENAPLPGRIAVLGAGRGQDALLFAERGFEVVGFDFAPSAVNDANELAQARGYQAQFLQRDIFKLSPEFDRSFDYVLEHTCFCAIDPTQREAYVQVVKALLRPAGALIALFWAHDRSGGPPFGTSLEEIRSRFMPTFEIVSIDRPKNSIERRRNEEYLIVLRKPSVS